MKSVVIIGGGLGGLTSGALLAKQGYRVTLLEQHNIIGGSATRFKRRGGFNVEVGLHEMDDPFAEGSKKEIFTALGVYDNIEFVQPKELFHVKTANYDFTMPDGFTEAYSALVATFPDETEGIKAYFELITAIALEYEKLVNMKWWQKLLFPFIFKSIFKYRQTSLQEVLDTLFKDEELKLILCTNIQYYHDRPSDFSFLYHSIAQYAYYNGGGWFIKGGSQELSNYLASIITEYNGTIIKKANVVKVLQKKGSAIGVVYEKKGTSISLEADIIISNASPMQTYEMASLPYTQDKTVGISLYTLYLGFSQNIKTVYGEKAYSQFNYSKFDSLDTYTSSLQRPMLERGHVFVDYSQIDAALTDKDKSLGVICGVDYLKDWEVLSDEAYKAKKEQLTITLIAELEATHPGISKLVEYAELATAKTMQRYLKTPEGTAYGFAPTAKQFFREPEVKSNKLENLYFVGAWVIGGGFTPAIMSGAMASREITK